MDWATITDAGGWATLAVVLTLIVRSGTREPPLWVLGREYQRLQRDYDTKVEEHASTLATMATMQQEERKRLMEENARLRERSSPQGGAT